VRSDLAPLDAKLLLADLDPEQEAAVRATSGPVAIHAGAGSGKTRVISRRTAYAIASNVVPADQVLVVTFTDKAATEMVDRLRSLGLPGVTVRTFHAHALSQLRHFWPARHDGASMPTILDERGLAIWRLARQLPGNYKFTPSKDLADEIGWAKARRITPRTYELEAERLKREPPIPIDLFVRVFGNYERNKARANQLDFDDLLTETVELLETDPEGVADLRALEEPLAPNPERDACLRQGALDRRDLGIDADEDRDLGGGDPLPRQPPDRRHQVR
jgi:DNA helicase-2/ATP-dependent DNA helicase PcrA